MHAASIMHRVVQAMQKVLCMLMVMPLSNRVSLLHCSTRCHRDSFVSLDINRWSSARQPDRTCSFTGIRATRALSSRKTDVLNLFFPVASTKQRGEAVVSLYPHLSSSCCFTHQPSRSHNVNREPYTVQTSRNCIWQPSKKRVWRTSKNRVWGLSNNPVSRLSNNPVSRLSDNPT